MATLTHHLRLLLIIAIVLSPVQSLFAMQADDSMALPMNMLATTINGDIARSDASKMLGDDCNTQEKCSNCQAVNHCSSCPLLLGIPQIVSKCVELNTQTQLIVPDASLHSADLLPDYRPPRYF